MTHLVPPTTVHRPWHTPRPAPMGDAQPYRGPRRGDRARSCGGPRRLEGCSACPTVRPWSVPPAQAEGERGTPSRFRTPRVVVVVGGGQRSDAGCWGRTSTEARAFRADSSHTLFEKRYIWARTHTQPEALRWELSAATKETILNDPSRSPSGLTE